MAAPFPTSDENHSYPSLQIPMNPGDSGFQTDPTVDDLTSDWTQWMRWDDFDIDAASSHLDTSSSPNEGLKSPDENQPVTPTEVDLSTNQQPISLNPSTSMYGSASPPDKIQTHDFSTQQSNAMLSDLAMGQSNRDNSISSISTVPRKSSGDNLGSRPILPLAPSSSMPATKKRKSVTEESDNSGDTTSMLKVQPSKKRSHNVIEKRYRANLNDKIAELRESVPSLRVLSKSRNGSVGGLQEYDDDVDSVTPNNKLNKASILSKATEYIRHLELRNKRLDEENIALKNRLRQLEKTQDQHNTSVSCPSVTASSPGGFTVSTESGSGSSPVFSHVEEFSPESSPNPMKPPEGLIKVPEYLKRFRNSEPQPHYADSHVNSNSGEGGSRRSGMPNKFMLGTLAGLMVVGKYENQNPSESSEKGLFALPLQLSARFYRFMQSCLHTFATKSWQIRALFQVSLTMVFVVACAFFVFLYLFNSKPRRSTESQKRSRGSPGDTIVSPIEIRRQAWLTSIQTVWVPSHTFFPEWFAVTSRWIEYTLRCLLGWKLYSKITGITADDEKARVKAWDIALDAQLTGGDPEVSKSRLVLTIFAAGTLPSSPARVMLKALHCRILLWRVGNRGSISCRLSNYLAFTLANYQWRIARELQKSLPDGHEDSLPKHLSTLLEMDLDEVFTSAIVQRASNMAWNRPTQEATDGEDAMLDVVVEDSAVRSPLDALAAWWSSRKLQDTLMQCIEFEEDKTCDDKDGLFERNLDLALKSAPPASAACTRAAVVKAVFFDADRVTNINSVLAALPRSKDKPTISTTNFLDSSVPPSARGEISIAVRCAMIAAILKGQVGNGPSSPSQLTLRSAIDLFNILPTDPVELTLLGFASLYHLLHVFVKEDGLYSSFSSSNSMSSSSCLSDSGSDSSSIEGISNVENADAQAQSPVPDLARVASGLIYWVRNAYNPISSGFTAELMDAAAQGCVDVCRDAGLYLDIEKDEWKSIRCKKSHKRKSSKSTPALHEEVEPSHDEDGDPKSRRESVRSTDTGYGSLSQDEDGGETTTKITPIEIKN